mgnify:CR=1 FL=1|tara:strand:+ start:21703 stop:23019 length:1317 start_codon:yes stop_codon:yes gene_type:complete
MANRVPLILNTSLNQIQELPTGDNLDLSNSGIHNAGIITATTFSGDGSQLTGVTAGNASGLTGTPDITVGNIIAQNVSIASTLTYEDVTNIDSVGLITARDGIDCNGDLDVDGHTNLDNVSVAGVSTFTGQVNINGTTNQNGELKIIPNGSAVYSNIKLRNAADSQGAEITCHDGGSLFIDSAGGGSINYRANGVGEHLWQTAGTEKLRITSAGNVGINSTSPNEVLDVVGNIDIKGGSNSLRITSTAPAVKFTDSDASGGFGMVGVNNTSGSLVLRSDDGNALSNTFMGFEVDGSERLRITSTGGVIFKGGPLQEKVKITAGKLSDNTTIDLADGNVHYFTTQESTTSTPNLRVNSTTTLDSVMAVGETIAVTIITTAVAGGYSDQLQIDGSNVTENWVGGSAPTAGGGSGVDIYNYTIIKTAANTYTVIANLTKTS